jgi:hypothetical protein
MPAPSRSWLFVSSVCPITPVPATVSVTTVHEQVHD